MGYSLKINFLTAFLSLNWEFCVSGCTGSEYKTNGLCCPMCAEGYRVGRHCVEFEVTICVPCTDSTFLDEPNGLTECFNCTVCESGQGLRIQTPCTRSLDTVCEPLEGHYCTKEKRGSCIHALKHSQCHPGQYIKQIGTSVKDTECAACADGIYTTEICPPHSKCEDLGLSEVKPGTLSSDAECVNKTPAVLIENIGVFLIIIVSGAAIAVFIFLKKKIKETVASSRPDTVTLFL